MFPKITHLTLDLKIKLIRVLKRQEHKLGEQEIVKNVRSQHVDFSKKIAYCMTTHQ